MYAHELFEAGKPNIVVTYPGRFQPFHQGHAGVFAQLQKKFGRDSVFILTSNDQSSAKSPFNFSDKYQLITAAGVPGDRIIETNKMYVLPEGMDPTNTIFITAVGAPDATRLSPDSFLKRDRKDAEGNIIKPAGSPSYYKTWGGAEEPMTADQHGYVIVIPEIKKNVTLNGQTYDVSHGTECRNLWNQVRNDEKARDEFLKALYGKSTAELVHIFNKIPDAANEDVDMDSIAEDASGYIPKNKKEANDPRWSNALTVDVHTDTPQKNLKAFRLAEFAPNDSGDDGEGFDSDMADMAYKDGIRKGVSLADAKTAVEAIAINLWHKQAGGIYKQYFFKGFIEGRKEKIRHDNKQYNLNLQLIKDGSIRHGDQGVAEAYDHNAPFNAADFNRHMAQLRAREELRKTDPMKALVGDLKDQDAEKAAAADRRKKPEDDSIGINDPRHPGYAYSQAGQTDLNEFAPDDSGGSRKFIPWPEFIDAVKQIVGKDFNVTEKVIKSTIQDRFIPHDPMEYGPTMLYSYYEARLGRGKGAVSTRGSIQVGKYYPNNTALGKQNFITSFNLLKGHPFERHFDLTFDNIYKIANIIMGNTEGAYQMPQQQGVAEGLASEKYIVQIHPVENGEVNLSKVEAEHDFDTQYEAEKFVGAFDSIYGESSFKAVYLGQGVAEGLSDIVKGVKRSIKGKEHPDVVAAKHLGRAMGHYNQGDIKSGDKESNRYVKTRDIHLKAQGVAEEQVIEIGYADELGKLTKADHDVISAAKQVGTISQKPVMKYEQGNATLFFFTDNAAISALVLIADGNKLRAIKNFSNQPGQIYALINYIVNINNTRLIVTPDEPLTKEGLQWIAKLIKNPSGLKVLDFDGDPIDVETLHDEWLNAKSTQGTKSGKTGIVISESSLQWKRKLQENQNRLMPYIYFNVTGKQAKEENLDEDFGDFDSAVKQLKENKSNGPALPEVLAKFLPIAMKELKIKTLPQIKLEKHIETQDGQASFGRFVNDENVIHLAILDRHPLDTLRTLAHELVHYKQFLNDELNNESGITGSPEENEAHAIAGVIMRHFNKAYPELIKLNPIDMN